MISYAPVGEVQEKHLLEDCYEYSIELTNGQRNRTAVLLTAAKIPKTRLGSEFLSIWAHNELQRWKREEDE